MVSCPMMPLGPASVGTGMSGRTFFDAAHVAEAAGEAQRAGRKRRCSRDSKTVVSPEECLAKFRAGLRPCVTPPEEMGRCTTGQIEDAKHPEGIMAKSNYGKCIVCGRTGNRDSAGRCYNTKCKEARQPALVDPLEMRECPEEETRGGGLTAENSHVGLVHEAETTGENKGTGVAASAQAKPFGKTKELPGEAEQLAGIQDIVRQHAAENGIIVQNLPAVSPDVPVVIDGVTYTPFEPCRQPAREPIITVRASCLSFSVAAVNTFDLRRFKSVRLFTAPDGIGMSFSPDAPRGYLSVAGDKSSMVCHAQAFVRHFGLKGREGVMREERPGFYVVTWRRSGSAQGEEAA